MGILNRMGLVIARKWIGGTTVGEAIEESSRLNSLGEKVIVNYLGEDIVDRKIVAGEVSTYLKILDQMKSRKIKGGIAVKPTQLGLDIDYNIFVQNYTTIVKKADNFGIFVWLDMEDYKYVDDTIRAYMGMIGKHRNIGICIQAKLRRSMSDLKKIVPNGAIVRLVKGAYANHGNITYDSKPEINQNYEECMTYLFSHSKSFMLATHDDKLIKEALILQKRYKRNVMFGMLKGIRPALALQMERSGNEIYIYVPFGNEWMKYSVRRLKELEHSILFIRSIFQS